MITAGDLELRDPIPGESLDGFVAAIVGDNDLVKVRSVSAVGGITYGHRPQLTTTGWKALPALAEILEVDVEELTLRSYPAVGIDGSRRAFFGTTVHRADLRTRERFFSPEALAASPHHRAMWQLKLPFDGETGELLVCRCTRPDCGKIQRWRHSAGIAWCDACVQDLSAQTVPVLGEDLLADYRHAVGLTHTDPRKRTESLALLPERLRVLGADMAFELLLRLCPIVDQRCSWSRGSRIWSNDPFIIAGSLQRAWHLLLSWPNAFLSAIAVSLGRAEARFGDGTGGAILRFFRLRHGDGVAPAVAAEIRAVHDIIDIDGPNADEIRAKGATCHEASALSGVSTRHLAPLRRGGVLRTIPVARGPLILPYLDRAEIMAIKRDMERRWDLSRAVQVLGLPYYAIERICARGRIDLIKHPYFQARYPEPQTTEAAVRAFEQDLSSRAIASLSGAVPILGAVRAVGGRLKPWAEIVDAMLTKDGLAFGLTEEGNALFDRVRVRRDDLRSIIGVAIGGDQRRARNGPLPDSGFRFAEVMTKSDAGEVLNICSKQFTPLLRHYPTTSSRVVPISDVLRISSAHISATEIAERLAIPYQRVRWRLGNLGLAPISVAGYCRAAVEQLVFAGDGPAP